MKKHQPTPKEIIFLDKISEEAEAGDHVSQRVVAEIYLLGKYGIDKDESQAFNWYKEAAEQEDEVAQCNVGWFYYADVLGEGADYNKAVAWFRRAAEHGQAIAQNNLAFCYEYGKGVKQDLACALKWYLKAGEQGLKIAHTNFKRCCLKAHQALRTEFKGSQDKIPDYYIQVLGK